GALGAPLLRHSHRSFARGACLKASQSPAALAKSAKRTEPVECSMRVEAVAATGFAAMDRSARVTAIAVKATATTLRAPSHKGVPQVLGIANGAASSARIRAHTSLSNCASTAGARIAAVNAASRLSASIDDS